jgi:pantoate--beta-alanine ligase
MIIARTLAPLREQASRLPGLALVPTMGALHAGHIGLIAAAKAGGGPVAASIFVNPTQFLPGEDFLSYPRDEAGDLAALEAAGCDLVWLPEVATMYPQGDATRVHVAGPALLWEGAIRPGHFEGVATVVTKLFGQVRPTRAYFGEKDWQQIQVISRLTTDLALGVEIVPVPTVREPDGLALSSRNQFLRPDERARAPALARTLHEVAARIARGADIAESLEAGRLRLQQAGLAPDYLALVEAQGLAPLDHLNAPARLLCAARLGRVRLLDNVPVMANGSA